ncbi:MAG TPA: hypothetical protein VK206_00990 [Anaerolineales bacterium]|nr:hypothetical protein [Anaerolineales bacterium]
MKAFERERNDWIIILIILLIGFLCVILAGGWALRFPPNWELNANMESNLNPNIDFLTRKPSGFIEPVDPSILTAPVWINIFLTPGASFATGTARPPTTGTSFTAQTITSAPFIMTTTSIAPATNTAIVIQSPTKTLNYYPPTPFSTSQPKSSSTFTPTPTAPFTSTPTQTSTPTLNSTFTLTTTSTDTATPSFTDTPDPSEPDFGAPDGNTITLGNGTSVVFNLSAFVLNGDSTLDAVYYEKEETSSSGKIHLGAVLIEVYDQTTDSWYTVYYWGDGVIDTNASYNNGNSEPDGFPVDKSLLYGVAPLNTGLAIDIDTPAIAQGGSSGDSITQIRITSLSNVNCEMDAFQMLR